MKKAVFRGAHKIFSGRERDFEDVRKILNKQDIDRTYIIQWLKEFDASFQGGFVNRFTSLLS